MGVLVGKVSAPEGEKRKKGSWGCFWTGNILHLLFLTMCFFLHVYGTPGRFSTGVLDLLRVSEIIQ